MTFTGDKLDCMGAMETYVQEEITTEKPQLNHLIMVIEHLLSAFCTKFDRYSVEFSVDKATSAVSFSATKL